VAPHRCAAQALLEAGQQGVAVTEAELTQAHSQIRGLQAQLAAQEDALLKVWMTSCLHKEIMKSPGFSAS
jgi:hypothetical protein